MLNEWSLMNYRGDRILEKLGGSISKCMSCYLLFSVSFSGGRLAFSEPIMSLVHNLAFFAECYLGKIHFYVISNHFQHFKLLVLVKRLPFLVVVGGCGFSQDIITIKLPEIILKYYKIQTSKVCLL